MKRIISVFLVISVLFSLSSCSVGEEHIKDPKQYKRNDGARVVSYFPKNLERFTVNDYSYTSYGYLDRCTEIFLDITVSGKRFNKMIESAKEYSKKPEIKQAYYNKEYTEIIYDNLYDLDEDSSKKEKRVGHANIAKVIYNKKKHNIVYVYFYAFDTGVFPLKNVEYFNRFGIKEAEYAEHSGSYYEKD